MAQVIVYGRRDSLARHRAALSTAIHEAVMAALEYQPEKRSVEITITETPKVNWGIRGSNAADLALGYRVEV